MKKKVFIPILILMLVIVGGAAAYKVSNTKKAHAPKINGTIYVLPKTFTLNLRGGQYATLTVALLLPSTETVGATNPNNPPPTGFGTLPEEAAIRAIITNDVTDQPEAALITPKGRHRLEAKILAGINHQTDTTVSAIYFTDLAVQ